MGHNSIDDDLSFPAQSPSAVSHGIKQSYLHAVWAARWLQPNNLKRALLALKLKCDVSSWIPSSVQ